MTTFEVRFHKKLLMRQRIDVETDVKVTGSLTSLFTIGSFNIIIVTNQCVLISRYLFRLQ